MEKLGYPKRDLMISRVKAAKESQDEAKTQFKSALEQFQVVLAFKGGELQDKYETLEKELAQSEKRAKAVHDKIASVENVSDALFKEWKGELKTYQSAKLRAASEVKLKETERKYDEMMAAMKKAESKLEPVLQPLRDNVMFLKHNLNARAIASLSGELSAVEANVDVLVADLERSSAEAARFIEAMDKNNKG